MSACPCGSGEPYAACCGPILAGEVAPPTAEALMRARYSAHVRAAIDFLVATHDPATFTGDAAAIRAWARRSTWLGLTIHGRERGGVDDDDGVVTFTAHFHDGRQRQAHRERSRFRRLAGRWVYVDGSILAPAGIVDDGAAPAVARNAPCPCGSGAKYKRCCGRDA